jgi:hypothetical protein
MTNENRLTPASLTEMLGRILQKNWGTRRYGAKLLAEAMDVNERTANNLLEGRNAPSAVNLINLMAIDFDVFQAVVALTNRSTPSGLTENDRLEVVRLLRLALGNIEPTG